MNRSKNEYHRTGFIFTGSHLLGVLVVFVILVLCIVLCIVVPLPPGTYPLAVNINNNL